MGLILRGSTPFWDNGKPGDEQGEVKHMIIFLIILVDGEHQVNVRICFEWTHKFVQKNVINLFFFLKDKYFSIQNL